MAITYKLISSQDLLNTTATVTFSSIPQTFDHLVLCGSMRSASSGNDVVINLNLNGNTTTYTYKWWVFTGTSSDSGTIQRGFMSSGTSQPSNMFSFNKIYIPNYSKTIARTIGGTNLIESTGTYRHYASATNLNSTAPITSIQITETNGLVAGSSLSLYGISNS